MPNHNLNAPNIPNFNSPNPISHSNIPPLSARCAIALVRYFYNN